VFITIAGQVWQQGRLFRSIREGKEEADHPMRGTNRDAS